MDKKDINDAWTKWKEPVVIGEQTILKDLILAAGHSQISVTAIDQELVIMVELHPMYRGPHVQRLAVPLVVVQQVQRERIHYMELLADAPLSEQERLAMITQTPKDVRL